MNPPMSNRIDDLAKRFGIADGYVSEQGDWVTTPTETKAKVLSAMGVPLESDGEMPAPPRMEDIAGLSASAFWPQFLVDHRAWGFSVQAYALRSARNWGIGDFEDLAQLCETTAKLGADFIGVSPLHALFIAEPSRISPYSPSSRSFLNPLLIAPDRVPGFEHIDRPQVSTLRRTVRETELIDYENLAALKISVLEELFAYFLKTGDGQAKDIFEHYCYERGTALETHTLFEALSEHMVRQGHHAAWSTWPEAYRDPSNIAVRDFARAAKTRIAFHAWLQWTAETQLTDAQERARAAGMRIGLYLDLAVGLSPDGSACWRGGPAIAPRARIGCPPDPFSAQGQDWGLVPFSPVGLAQERLEPFRAVLRANMKHAGALRIDHAMGLERLYWIPEGNTAKDGAYVAYPFRELIEGVAEESRISQTVVIGEDLGTVPPGFTDTMVRTGLLSYQVFYFSAREDTWMAPHAYRREAMVCASTHDLPTLRGWWSYNDIEWRVRCGRATETEAVMQRQDRMRDRKRMLDALMGAGALDPDPGIGNADEMPDAVIIAVHRFLAATPSRLLSVQIDDALGVREQANLPGTIDEHPNWRRKIAISIEALTEQPLFEAVVNAIATERPKRETT